MNVRRLLARCAKGSHLALVADNRIKQTKYRWMLCGGFTLLEVMVVIAIMGIVTTFAWLTIDSGSSSERLLAEAQRIAVVVEQQRYEATLNGEIRGLAFNQDQYNLQRLSAAGEWIAQSKWREFPSEMTITLSVEGSEVELNKRAGPQIILTPSGEVSEFSLVIFGSDASHVAIEADLLGRIELSPGD